MDANVPSMSNDPNPPDHDALLAARAKVDAGAEAAGERVFLELLSRHRATSSRIEQLACSSLISLYGRQRRHFEVITLASRLRAIADVAEDGSDSRMYAAFARASSWINLHAVEPAELELGRMRVALADVDPERAQNMESWYRLLRTRIAIETGDAELARKRFAFYASGLPADDSITRDEAHARDTHDAEVCLLEGRVERGLELVASAESVAVEAADVVSTWIVKLRLLARDARHADLRAGAAPFLDMLERFLDDLPFASQAAWDGACCVMEVLDGVDDAEPLIVRAWDVASTSLVRRLQELQRAADVLPELTQSDPRDLDLFRGIRDQSQRWREEERDRLLPLLDRADEALRSSLEEPLILICAWCDSIHVGDGRWLPLLESYEAVGPVRASHGMCATCAVATPIE